ncbi:MAG TPA: CHAT domain-containing protein [Pyrinomonadaceae bacterium]|jgi:hypothetical protein
MSDKIKILYVAANPVNTGHLRLQEEARDLEERIRQAPHREAFAVIHCLAARPRDLLRGLQEVQPHVLHFSGHGTAAKEIVLQDDDGASRPIAPQVLAGLVNLFSANLKVAVMSCCFGRSQAKALSQVLDFTIGMNKPISDSAAVEFSATFYQVLAAGGSVRQAFEAARLLTSREGRKIFEKSDLLVRAGVCADDPLIKLPPPVEPPPPRPTNAPAPAGGNQVIAKVKDTRVGVMNNVAGNNNQSHTHLHVGDTADEFQS